MSATSDLLFAYLREIFYGTSQAKLEIEKLDEDFIVFSKTLMFFARCFEQYNHFANALAKGDLSAMPPPPENEIAAPLKSLHARLKHLTWQSKQVALGDYGQHVDFMGEFADGFNTIVEQLADRQQKLENEINQSKKHAKALEQSNLLLSSLTHYIPQQLFVVAAEKHEVLLFNNLAKKELYKDSDYVHKVMEKLPDPQSMNGSYYCEIKLGQGDAERYLEVNSYSIEWNRINAVALVINDISDERKQRLELEDKVYRDSLTRVYNRFYGMLTLSDWVEAKKRFALVFVDLDSLKYVNDAHGHNEGDEYIIRVSSHLAAFSPDAVVCRLGGDEFMLLIPDINNDGAHNHMAKISDAIENDEYLIGKGFRYSISYGIVAVDEKNDMPSSNILSVADERMYEHKRLRKKERRDQSDS
ncbi:MAG: diguanylate cyclase [Oscillospiraceae bacterium]|nr:diguanylate cyclase [Oscillospiraceae bacterium]